MHMARGGDAQGGRGDARASCASPLVTPLAGVWDGGEGWTRYSPPHTYNTSRQIFKSNGFSSTSVIMNYIKRVPYPVCGCNSAGCEILVCFDLSLVVKPSLMQEHPFFKNKLLVA
jgi:hypothetical protein